MQFLKSKYVESKLGEEFVGTISGVVPFGVFVTIDETLADGLLHTTTLPRDHYELGRDKVSLVGRKSGFSPSLGERVKVKIASVNADNGKVDFEFAGREGGANEKSKKNTMKTMSSSRSLQNTTTRHRANLSGGSHRLVVWTNWAEMSL